MFKKIVVVLTLIASPVQAGIFATAGKDTGEKFGKDLDVIRQKITDDVTRMCRSLRARMVTTPVKTLPIMGLGFITSLWGMVWVKQSLDQFFVKYNCPRPELVEGPGIIKPLCGVSLIIAGLLTITRSEQIVKLLSARR
jgi:hypothetical protein